MSLIHPYSPVPLQNNRHNNHNQDQTHQHTAIKTSLLITIELRYALCHITINQFVQYITIMRVFYSNFLMLLCGCNDVELDALERALTIGPLEMFNYSQDIDDNFRTQKYFSR